MTAKILIVEDEALIAQEIEAVLAGAGFVVAGLAATVPKALALITAGEFEAAVLDANLRGQSAEPVAQALRQAEIPFLIISGYSKSHLIGPLLNAPHLPKPFQPEALVRAVKELTTAPG
jgi:DNA-binding response OmpR family regulator